MLPKQNRLTRTHFLQTLANKGLNVVYNRLGTLKYLPGSTQIAVVTSSKAEKQAVSRNKLRRRIYSIIAAQKPQIQGIVYVSKQSYGFTYSEVKNLTLDLLARTQQPAK